MIGLLSVETAPGEVGSDVERRDEIDWTESYKLSERDVRAEPS